MWRNAYFYFTSLSVSLKSVYTFAAAMSRRQVAARVGLPLPIVMQPPLWFPRDRDVWQTEHFQLQHHQHGTVYYTMSATAKVLPVCIWTLRLTFSLQGAKVPGNESSTEWKFPGTFAPRNESSRERKFQGAKVPPYGTFAPGSESS